MKRPYINCHMVISLDGKVTGNFLYQDECFPATEVYYHLNREYKKEGYQGFICGRITMETSFPQGECIDLNQYQYSEKINYLPLSLDKIYAISFDPSGKLAWKNAVIDDLDPGYDDSYIIEVVTEKIDGRFLSYLKEKNIPFIVAGREEIDVNYVLNILYELGIKKLLLEGGSIINGKFLKANCIDELSLVVAPLTGEKEDKPLFDDSSIKCFELNEVSNINGVVTLKYILK